MTTTQAKGAPAEVAQQQAQQIRELFTKLRTEIGRVFVGQQELVDLVLSALAADGHVLLEGVPGLGKTLLVRTLASAIAVPFSRVQFTPDLMPADITGTMVLAEKAGGGHELRFQPGPLMASVVLADEINRATPKTQSALLEAMQERQITVGGKALPLPEPFIVLATQNPVEQEGTYPLPEAQLDRFLMKLLVDYPSEQEYHGILDRTTTSRQETIKNVCTAAEIMQARQIVRQVPVSHQVQTYAIRLTLATHPKSEYAPDAIRESVTLGASPRAAQALLLRGKGKALLSGRFAVSCQDIRDVLAPVVRHRLVLRFAAQSQGVTADDLLPEVLKSVPEVTEKR